MKIDRLVLFKILFISCLSSCVSTKHRGEFIEGSFYQEDNGNVRLTFLKDHFYFTDPYTTDLALYQCCDTITHGKWSREGGLIVLETPQLEIDSLSLEVEETNNMNSDSIYVYITNPIEEYHKDYRLENNRSIKYDIMVKAKNSIDYSRKIAHSRSNVISIAKPRNVLLESISIVVTPTENFGGRNISVRKAWTERYTVRSESSNVFKVEIPQITLPFLTLVRLKRDFVRIIDKNTLEWDGEKYFRM